MSRRALEQGKARQGGVGWTVAALSLVAVKKFGKDATLAVSASSKYDAPGAPSYGAQLTIG